MARTYFSLTYSFHWIFFSASQFTFSVFTLTGSVTGWAPDVRAASVIASAVNLLKISAALLEHLMVYSRAKLFNFVKFKDSGKSVCMILKKIIQFSTEVATEAGHFKHSF